MTEKIGVVLVNYHTDDDIIKAHNMYSSYPRINNICVVNNDSCPESENNFLLEINDFKTHFIFNQENLGYSKGNNQGLRYLEEQGCDFLIVSNSDVFVSEQAIRETVDHLKQNEEYGALAPRMVFPDQRLANYRKIALGYLRVFLRVFLPETYIDSNIVKNHEAIQEQSFLPGSFFIITQKAFDKCKGFDEHIFLYREEEILGKRLNCKGFKLGVVKDCYYIHNHNYKEEDVAKKLKRLQLEFESESWYFSNYLKAKRIQMAYVELMQRMFYISRFIIWNVIRMFKR